MVSVTAQAVRPAGRRFYVAIGLLGFAVALAGFWPSYFGPVLLELAEKPLVLHVHAAVFVGWLALFTAQAGFAAARRIDLHVRVGRLGIGYGFLVIVVGLTTGYLRASYYAGSGDFIEGSNLLYSATLDMAVFTPFFVAAVLLRRKPELHKRLMIVAGTSLLVAAVFRMNFLLGTPRNLWLAHAIWFAPVWLTLIADYRRRRAIHPVLIIGLVGLTLQSPMFRAAVRGTATWRSLSGWLLGAAS